MSKIFWKNKKILITGINGFVGSNLAKELIFLKANVSGIILNKKKTPSYILRELIKNVNYTMVIFQIINL